MQDAINAIIIVNTIGSPKDNILITGIIINGGAITDVTSLIRIGYTDNVTITDIESDGNLNSTDSTDIKLVDIVNSDRFSYFNNKALYDDPIRIGTGVTNYIIHSDDTIKTDESINDVTISQNIIYNAARATKETFSGFNQQLGTLYDTISPHLPNVNDEIIASGVMERQSDAALIYVNSFKRFSSTVITVQCYSTTATGPANFTISTSSTALYDISLAI